jgi:polyisoprenoid-binding protein YceI
MPRSALPALPALPPLPRRAFAFAAAAALLATATALCATEAGAQSAASVLPAQSEIAFTTRQMGVPVEGRFGRFGAQVELDPRRPENGRIAFTIDTASARFGTAELDAEVGKPVWLSVARFPQASFQSSAIRATGPNRFEVSGRLTIKGQARDLTVPVQLAPGSTANAPVTASGSFTIRRLDFSVGEAEWADTSLLANEVQVRFRLALAGLGPL